MLLGDRPTAIFVANDYMAMHVMDEIRYKYSLNIPKDISVVGYDNIKESSFYSYSLTTFSQPVDKMVEHTLKILFDKDIVSRISLDGELIIRNSTKKLTQSG